MSNQEPSPLQLNFVAGVVDHFEGKFATLRLEDGQQINWPREKLPAGIKEGGTVKLFVSSSATEEEERSKMAKSLLNEILKSS